MKTVLICFGALACLLSAGFASPVPTRKAESRQTQAQDPRGIAGPWEGQWTSEKNGHKGALSCQVEPAGGDRYVFRYRAHWGRIMKGNFQVTCTVTPSGKDFAVVGTKSLGLFGTYRHEGTISPHRFQATFRSDGKDLGSFRLKRPEGWKS